MKDLRTYLEELRSTEGALVQVDRPVDRVGEISAVVKALEPAGKPAVLFTNVIGSDLPVLMGLFGTRERIASAVGVDRRQLVRHVVDLMSGELPQCEFVTESALQDVSEGDVDLGSLPIGVHSRDDAGRYITSGVVTARDPASDAINTGMYRIMVTGPRTMTINAAPDHDLGRIFAAAAQSGTSVPVAVVLGHHPAFYVASQLKNPVHVDTHRLAGALLGEPLRLTPGSTIDLHVPADAEVVLEGLVQPANKVAEGPFGEFTYYYGAAQAPVCTVTAIRRRADAIFHDLHPTHDEHRCLWLFPGREARLLEAVRRVVPGVADVRIPFYAGSLSAYVSVRKSREGDGKQALLAALASDHFIKHVIVVDDDIDLHDDTEVLWASHVRAQGGRDLVLLRDMKGIRMDPSARAVGESGDRLTDKLGLDATRPLHDGFPERADLPFRGFEDLDLRQYLSGPDLQRVSDAAHWRRWMQE